MLPGDVKPPESGTERRRQRAPRAPSMRWAQACDSAEQLGVRLRGRYQRQQQRQGIGAEAELDRILCETPLPP